MIIRGKYWRKDWNGIPQSTRRFLLGVSLISTIYILIVANPVDYYFLNDDFQHIPLAAQGHFLFGQFLRPVSDLLFWLENRLWGRNAPGYHLTNLCLHLLNAGVVFLLSRSLFIQYGGKGNPLVKAIFVTLLFLLFGFHSETLFWILGRGGSLGSLFFLLACYAFLKRQQGIGWFYGSLVFFTLGLLSYESTWIYPLVIGMVILADAKKEKITLKRGMIYGGVTVLAFALYLVFFVPRKAFFGNEYALHNLTDFHPIRLFYNYNTLLARILIPPMHNSRFFLVCYLFVFMVLAGLFAVGIWKKRSSLLEYLAMGGLLVSVLPEISLGISTHNSESERFIYLPSFFFLVWFVETGFRLIKKSLLLEAFLILLLMLHALQLNYSARTYRLAGNFVQKSLKALDEKREINTVDVFNLPLQYEGALMFRSGLPESFQWICPGLKFSRMEIIDSMRLLSLTTHFQVREMDLDVGLQKVGGKKTGVWGPYSKVYLGGHTLNFQQGRDMILYWTDSCLVKIY